MKLMNKIICGLSALVIGVATLCSCAPTKPINAPTIQQSYQQSEPTVKESAFVTIDINPSIELVLNKDHIVTSVSAVNDDAEILLWQEDLCGMTLDAAVTRIATLAVEMGYITEEDRAISVTVTTDGGKTVEQLMTTIDQTIEKTTAKAGLNVRVEEAIDLVLTKELERVKAKNVGKKGYDHTLTIARYRLVKAAMRADRELTMDAAVLLTNEKLTERVDDARESAEAKFDEAWELARSEAEFAYENAKQTLLDSAYTAVYTSRRDLSSLFANYGAAYAGYRLAYRSIEHYAESLRVLIENPVFDEDDVFALANALGIDTSIEADYDAFKAAISDENGEITKESVNAYINQRYQNMDEEDRKALEAAYDNVLDLLDRLSVEASIVREDGLLLIRGALLGMGLSIEVKTYDDIPELLAAIQKKIDDTWARMDADLTENEKAGALEKQEKMASQISELEKTYKESVAQAKQEAEDRLTAAKERRAGRDGSGNRANGGK